GNRIWPPGGSPSLAPRWRKPPPPSRFRAIGRWRTSPPPSARPGSRNALLCPLGTPSPCILMHDGRMSTVRTLYGMKSPSFYNLPFAASSVQSISQRSRQRMEFLQSVTGKVVTGLMVLAILVAGISWWRMDESSRHAIVVGTGHIAAWLGIVLLLP